MKDTFEQIYDRNVWIKGSGWGSWPENTEPYVKFVQNFIAEHNVMSVVDAGCGDWSFSHLIDWSGVYYRGYDVVESVIVDNILRYSSDHVRFYQSDISVEQLPMADLILVKDVLMHWPPDIVKAFLDRLPDCRYVLITNDWRPEWPVNDERSGVGGYQNIDLTAPPYNLNVQEVLSYKVPHPRTERTDTKKVFLLKEEHVS